MTAYVIVLYDRYGDAEAAVRDLDTAAIPADDISVVASNLGDRYATQIKADSPAGAGSTGRLQDVLEIRAIPGVGPVVAGGWLVATSVGSGLIDNLVRGGIAKEEAQVYAEGVRRGGTIVVVRAGLESASQIRAILQGRPWVDPATRGRAYRGAGWSGFDENAPPYIPD